MELLIWISYRMSSPIGKINMSLDSLLVICKAVLYFILTTFLLQMTNSVTHPMKVTTMRKIPELFTSTKTSTIPATQNCRGTSVVFSAVMCQCSVRSCMDGQNGVKLSPNILNKNNPQKVRRLQLFQFSRSLLCSLETSIDHQLQNNPELICIRI